MNIKEILKKQGKRITPERLDLFNYILDIDSFSANELVFNTNFSRASIFRNINLFLEIGVIRKVSLSENWVLYEVVHDTHTHHEHMLCTNCWEVLHFESDYICKELFKIAKKSWFKINEHSIFVNWVCSKCI